MIRHAAQESSHIWCIVQRMSGAIIAQHRAVLNLRQALHGSENLKIVMELSTHLCVMKLLQFIKHIVKITRRKFNHLCLKVTMETEIFNAVEIRLSSECLSNKILSFKTNTCFGDKAKFKLPFYR